MKNLIYPLLLLLLCSCQATDKAEEESNLETPTFEKSTNTKKETPEEGPYKEHYANGAISKIGNYYKGLEEGEWLSFYEDGQQWSKLYYKAGKKHGKVIAWYPNGKIRYEGYYKEDKKKGEWKFYDEEENLAKKISY